MARAKRASVGSHQRPQPLDLSQIYPCPCCHQGQLRGITLTEAFGCERCQYIFALTPDHCHIENLTASYPYRKLWYWSGQQWIQTQEETETQSWMRWIWVPVPIVVILVVFLISLGTEFPWRFLPLFLLMLSLGLGGVLLISRR